MTRRQRTTLFLTVTTALLVLAGATYTVYWFYVAARIPAAVAAWAAEQGEAGYDVAYSDVEVSGFPGPFRIHVTDPIVSLRDEGQPWIWQSRRVEGSVGPFGRSPIHYNIPGAATLKYRSPGVDEQISVSTAASRGHVTLNGDGEPEFAVADLDELRVTLAESMEYARVAQAHLEGRHRAASKTDSRDGDVRLSWSLRDVILPEDQAGPLGPNIAGFSGDTRITRISADLARMDDPQTALNAWREGGGEVPIHEIKLDWGPLKLTAQGLLALDADMRPSGVIETRTTGYRETIEALVRDGTVKKGDASTALFILEVMAQKPKDGGPKVLRVPFKAQQGELFIGAIRIGPLPALRIPAVPPS